MAGSARLGFLALPAGPKAAPRRRSLVRVAVLVTLLPLFFQTFHYMIDLPPAYALSKAWPLLTLPLAAVGLLAARPPYAAFYLCLGAYVLGLTPLLAALHLGSNLTEAGAAAIRMLPILHGLSLAGLLWLLRPDPADIRTALLTLGGITLAALCILWLTMPVSAYRSDPAESQVFFRDRERGFRIVLAMGFAFMLTFWLARRAVRLRCAASAIGVLASLATMVIIYKQRMAIAAVVAVLGLASLRGMAPRTRVVALAGGGALALAALFWWSFLQTDVPGDLLGGSLSVRLHSTQLAWEFIANDPWRWLFGVGSTTAYSDVTLAERLGFRNFYLTDIGWLGVVMEFGVAGGLLILGALIYCLLKARALAADAPSDFHGALSDHAWLLLLVTIVYSPVYAPGEMASLTALLWYLSRPDERALRP